MQAGSSPLPAPRQVARLAAESCEGEKPRNNYEGKNKNKNGGKKKSSRPHAAPVLPPVELASSSCAEMLSTLLTFMLGAAAGPREPERGGAGPGGGGAERDRDQDRERDRERGPASAVAAPPPPPAAARHGAGHGVGLWSGPGGDLSRCSARRAGEPERGSLPCPGSAGWEAAPAARAGRAWQRGKPRGRAREGRAGPCPPPCGFTQVVPAAPVPPRLGAPALAAPSPQIMELARVVLREHLPLRG